MSHECCCFMASLNFAQREILCKVVYYGPGLGGKTTNLQYIHNRVPEKYRGNLTSIDTRKDRTLFFDLLPLEYGKFRGFTIRLQLYTVPGQVFYNTSRKIVLKGVDGVVFVADSQMGRMRDNMESLKNLSDNLSEIGISPAALPMVLQFNKRDLNPIYSTQRMNEALNYGNFEVFEAVAITGQGVFNTLKEISGLVVKDIRRKYGVALESLAAGQVKQAGVAPGATLRKPSRVPQPAVAYRKPQPPHPTSAVRTASRGNVASVQAEVPVGSPVETAESAGEGSVVEKQRGIFRNVISALFKWTRKR